MDRVYLLYLETSDHTGASEVVAAFSTREKAELAGSQILTKRTFVTELIIDQKERKTDGESSD